MIVLTWYRFYASLTAGALVFFLLHRAWWLWLLGTVAFRTCWWGVERIVRDRNVKKLLALHSPEFKRLFGPYGIRIANKAEQERSIRESLVEVFTENRSKLQKAVEQLEMMDTLFKAGMRPEGDQFLLHDLKLKYGKHRLEEKG